MSDPLTTTPKIHQKSTFSGGLEGTLDVVAKVVLGATMVHAVAALAVTQGKAWPSLPGVLITGIVSWVTLRALAEIVRLLKKSAGLSYGGKISEATEQVEKTAFCAECGALLHSETRCETCGRTIAGASPK
jgi:hypothetical protein